MTGPFCRFDRVAGLARLAREHFDLVIVGGSWLAAACALDAGSRGMKVALLAPQDWMPPPPVAFISSSDRRAAARLARDGLPLYPSPRPRYLGYRSCPGRIDLSLLTLSLARTAVAHHQVVAANYVSYDWPTRAVLPHAVPGSTGMEEPFGGAAPTGPFGLSAEHVFGTDHCEPGDAGPNFEVAHFKDVAARLINARFGRRFGPSRSRFMALIGHSTYPVGRECRPEFLARYRAEAPIAEGLCEAVTDRTADPKGALNHRLVEAQPNPPDTARILFAARFEMAVHLADVVLRRGQHFMPESIPAVAHCLAQERGWTPSELLDEVTALQTEARSPQAAVEPDRVSEGS